MPTNLPDDNMTLPADDIFARIIGATLYLILLVLSACALFMAITTPSDVSFGWNTEALIELAQLLIGLPSGVLGVGISAYGILRIIRTKRDWLPAYLRRKKQ